MGLSISELMNKDNINLNAVIKICQILLILVCFYYNGASAAALSYLACRHNNAPPPPSKIYKQMSIDIATQKFPLNAYPQIIH